jgi:hypothetical protein
VLATAAGFPVIDARGTGGPIRGRRYGSNGLSFQERLALEGVKNQGRDNVQRAITDRLGITIPARQGIHETASGNALVAATTADKDREQRASQFGEELDKKYGRLDQVREDKIDEEVADLEQAIAVKEAEHRARGPGWFGPNQKDAKGKSQPGLYEKQAAEIEWMKERHKQLTGRRPAAGGQ